MRIQLDYSPNLDTREVHDYILDPKNTNSLAEALPTQTGYTLTNTTKSGTHEMTFYSSVKEYYNVLKRNTLVGNFDILVPVRQVIELQVDMHLLMKDDTPNELKQIIRHAFEKYDPAIDPIEYAEQQMGADITPDMFMVLPSFTIRKKGAPQLMTKQKEAILAMYDGTDTSGSTVDISDNENRTMPNFFHEKGLRAVYLKTENVGYIPSPPEDQLHEVAVADNSKTDVIDSILKQDTVGMDCTIYEVERIEKRIATLLLFPEFKIEWHQISIKIGCVRITFPVPILYARLSSKVLYAYVGKPNNVGKIFIAQVENCAIKAAVAGAVIGIVLGNFPGAIIAFKAVFTECIEYNAGQYVQCLVPGLALLTEPESDWAPIA